MPAAKKPISKTNKNKKAAIKKAVVKKPSKKTSKAAVKKVTSTKKTKAVSKKTTATKGTVKPKKTSVKKRIAEKKKTGKKVKETVNVPQNVPLRSIEKAAVLRSELSLYWQRSMHNIAFASGFCFLLIGATFASINIFGMAPITQNSASLLETQPLELATALTLQSPVPKEITNETKVLFTLTNAQPQSVTYYFLDQDTQKVSQQHQVTALQDNKYTFTIDPEQLSTGAFRLNIQYLPKTNLLNQSNRKIVVVAAFVIPQNSDTASSAKSVSEVEELESSTSTDDKILLQDPIASTANSVANATTTKATTTRQKPQTVSITAPPTDFSLYTKGDTATGILAINVINGDDLHNLELFARPVASMNSRFLTKANKRSGKLTFVISTETFLPNGKYEFYAQGINPQDQRVTTPSVLLTIENPTTLTNNTTVTATKAEVSATTTNEVSTELVRDFASLDLDTEDTSSTSQNRVTQASTRLLSENAQEIEKLLKQYAAAKQSNNEMLLTVARESLTEKKVQLANSVLVDDELAGISDDVILQMSATMADLQDKVDMFEKLRSEKTAGASGIDTDNDGISDFDEIILYGTDPQNPDTDGDGFLDGIEIMRGYDPLDAQAEISNQFQSPKNTVGLTQEQTLVVQEVLPIVNALPEKTNEQVLTQIKGRGLPNSFITLYIFSSPTVVTIKTDADGSFIYTLDKELEDGQHEVYVAITDNAGAIVAQSKAFSFVKQAQAFTFTDTAASGNITNQPVINNNSVGSYNAVIGLGVLSFGLILIMLGMTLRHKEEETVATANPKMSS